jgi:hypothetical protein
MSSELDSSQIQLGSFVLPKLGDRHLSSTARGRHGCCEITVTVPSKTNRLTTIVTAATVIAVIAVIAVIVVIDVIAIARNSVGCAVVGCTTWARLCRRNQIAATALHHNLFAQPKHASHITHIPQCMEKWYQIEQLLIIFAHKGSTRHKIIFTH